MNLNPIPYLKSLFVPIPHDVFIKEKRIELTKARDYYLNLIEKADLQVKILDSEITVINNWLKRHTIMKGRND